MEARVGSHLSPRKSNFDLTLPSNLTGSVPIESAGWPDRTKIRRGEFSGGAAWAGTCGDMAAWAASDNGNVPRASGGAGGTFTECSVEQDGQPVAEGSG
jgi:hypothetical protein